MVDVEVLIMMTAQDTVFLAWCRITGHNPADFGEDERDAFRARPQVRHLSRTPYALLLHAGIAAGRPGSLPLERWLSAVRGMELAAA